MVQMRVTQSEDDEILDGENTNSWSYGLGNDEIYEVLLPSDSVINNKKSETIFFRFCYCALLRYQQLFFRISMSL